MENQAKALPAMIRAIDGAIRANGDNVTQLDQAIGDGDHVFNLQRGIEALLPLCDELAGSAWHAAFKTIGMTVMSTIGGASGSLYATLFLGMAKSLQGHEPDIRGVAEAFRSGVEAVKARGKADVGEKTMLDVLVPVSRVLSEGATSSAPIDEVLREVCAAADAGLETTRDMLATKGRASFLGERARGHLDPGAKTAQLMICAVCGVLLSP
ncbi:dihydroxyacetone kinase subunit DhaL [Methylolobus aquaticus]